VPGSLLAIIESSTTEPASVPATPAYGYLQGQHSRHRQISNILGVAHHFDFAKPAASMQVLLSICRSRALSSSV
jgi:hypothetical protein